MIIRVVGPVMWRFASVASFDLHLLSYTHADYVFLFVFQICRRFLSCHVRRCTLWYGRQVFGKGSNTLCVVSYSLPFLY
jgi:hypothetical protein